MVLSIKDPETDELARRVASLKRVSITEAVKDGLRGELERLEAAEEERVAKRMAILKKYQAEFSSWKVTDPRPHGEILYDEDGLPA
ncbi:MAG: type II toxin-antitoxin system VapB family antitoxin [Mobiluncus porci]|uniref:Transcription factor n=1 Tax=Mobiluncus porci TaxID=2652278 RepID=A0A7K0K4C0_9ACTO|nr:MULTISPECIES: type II toxin-antitoxin system VapB family antitoxin [Mobiluncus]MCI6584187.1 type II toxin-antitoxin system VapB family antitoxin [Mobiluncus sp.]MDD7541899.1 type II toxin-antitoxin system VapB family antitoxin [Mobiluncus porci]MDY5749369.1 type II toxin-antitoxin system VapB family antitoxin [Mobiluncus porci]MST50289.1 transcription factor [Mobiluncus porci]